MVGKSFGTGDFEIGGLPVIAASIS